jgi:prepilin-type N-terminal cleavage/methylation domain-containing protein
MKRMAARNEGLTLLEMLVSLSLVGLIFAAIISIYVVGSKGWRKGNVRGELLQEIQVIARKLGRDIERSSLNSISVGPSQNQLSLLKLYDDDGDFVLDSRGNPLWPRGLCIFRKARISNFRFREVLWPADASTRSTPLPIEELNPPLTIADYASGGKKYSSNLEEFKVVQTPGVPTLSIRIILQKKVDSKLTESLNSEFTVRMRN